MKTNSLIELSCVEINNVFGGAGLSFFSESSKEIFKIVVIGVVAKQIDYLVHDCLSDDSCSWDNFVGRLSDGKLLQNARNKCISFIAGMIPAVPILVYINRIWAGHQKQD